MSQYSRLDDLELARAIAAAEKRSTNQQTSASYRTYWDTRLGELLAEQLRRKSQ